MEVNSKIKAEFLKEFGLSKLSMSMVVQWMNAVGFRYKNQANHYFVDGHEKPEMLAYCPIFTKQYLAHELSAHRWVQLNVADATLLEEHRCLMKNTGYHYTDSNNIEMVEYHVDSCSKMLPFLPYGGSLSVRKKPLIPKTMTLGQDEAIFQQFLFLSKMWTGPNGERPLLPKDKGAGVIYCSICQELGMIREIDDATLILVK